LIIKEGALHGYNICIKPQVGVSAKKCNPDAISDFIGITFDG